MPKKEAPEDVVLEIPFDEGAYTLRLTRGDLLAGEDYLYDHVLCDRHYEGMYLNDVKDLCLAVLKAHCREPRRPAMRLEGRFQIPAEANSSMRWLPVYLTDI
jgi:hypothetical protein